MPALLDSTVVDAHYWSQKVINHEQSTVTLKYILEGNFKTYEEMVQAVADNIDIAGVEDRGCTLIAIEPA